MRIATRDELLNIRPKTKDVAIPEIGPDVVVKVKAYSMGDRIALRDEIYVVNAEGERTYNFANDSVMSVVRALVEPQLNKADTEALLEVDDAIATRIVDASLELGGVTVGAFESFKRFFHDNPYQRRLWAACVTHFNRLPSELADISEQEFNMALAALEVDAEVATGPIADPEETDEE